MNTAVIFAGGIGSRMHSKDRPKQFLELYNKPIIIYTLEHFEYNPDVDAVVIACVKEWITYLEGLIARFGIKKVKKIVPGGETGQKSIRNGLLAAKEVADEAGKRDSTVVLIHDGVRPMINSDLITNCIKSVREFGSAITVSPLKETLIVLDEKDDVVEVPSRAASRVAKAPQCFFLKDILEAHDRAELDGIDNFIDSCTMMQYYGYPLHVVEGPYENIKITTPDDYYTMRALLEAKENAQIYGLD